jgi:hypothetical protein
MAHPMRASTRFARARKKKTPAQRADVDQTIRLLADNPRHNSLHTHKVQGARGVWESYINDGFRVTWHWDADVIVLRMNCNHDILNRRP